MGKYTDRLAGKTVVVVGGSSGIGFGAAEAFLAVGAHVTIVSSSQAHVDDAVKRLKQVEVENPGSSSSSVPVAGVVANVLKEAEFVEVLKTLAPIDHLVYSAIDEIYRGPLADADLADAAAHFGVKFWGSVAVGKALAKHDIVRSGGSLTLTSGAAAYRPGRNAVIGGALNAGVVTLTKGLSAELAIPTKRIRVNTVVPGLVQTELWDKAGQSKEQQKKTVDEASKRLSVGFVATPEDIAEAYLYTARANYANGSVILIDGGSTNVE